MPSEIAIRQRLFVKLLGKFIQFALMQPGFELTLGEGFDSERDGGHMHRSLHYEKLAQDFNLFVDDRYISQGGTPEWRLLGEFWESLHPLARWGGRFGDDNHVSIEWQGRK